MNKLITIRKFQNDEIKNTNLKAVTIAQIIIVSAIIIILFILVEDLYYILNSDGIWSVFGEKIVVSFIALIALIATINGKIGINTQWVHNYHIVLDLSVLKATVLNALKNIAVLSILLGLFSGISLLILNYKNIKKYSIDRIDYYTSSESQYKTNSIARKYAEKGTYKTDIKTTMHNGNVYICENKDSVSKYIFVKSLKSDTFVDMTTEEGMGLYKHNKNMYVGHYKEGEKVLTIMDDNKVLFADSNKTEELICYEHLKANI